MQRKPAERRSPARSTAARALIPALFIAGSARAQGPDLRDSTGALPEGEPAAPDATAPMAGATAGGTREAGPELAAAASSVETPTEVTVRAIRRAPGSFHAVSHRSIERYRYDDPHQLLSLVPGVYVRHEDGFGLRPNIGIRGATSDRSKKVALMEDGVLLAPAPYSAPAAYYFPVLARAYQMRVMKGPASIPYGPQTIGGAIDILTRPIPVEPQGAVDVSLGSYGHGKMHAFYGASAEDFGFQLEGVHLQSDGFKVLPGGGDTGFYRNEWSFKAERVFAPHSEMPHELSVKLMYSDEASNETYLGLTDADFRDDPRRRYAASALDRMEWHRTSGVLSYRLEPMTGMTLTATAYRHDLARVWRKFNGLRGANVSSVLRDPDTPQNTAFLQILVGEADGSSSSESVLIGPNDRDFVSQGVQTHVKWQTQTGSVAHQLEYGLRFHHDRVERRHSEDAFRMLGGRLVPEGSPTIVNTYNEAETGAVALHALDAMTWLGLTFTPALRAELIHSTFRDHIGSTSTGASVRVLLPGAGLHYALTDELGLLAGAHRGMSPPAPGSESSQPELSWNYEAGARWSGRRRRFELIGYYNDYSNLANVCTFSSGCSDQDIDAQFDAGRARIYGFEAFADVELELRPFVLPLSATYTFTASEFMESFQSEDPIFGDVTAGDELPYVPRHQGRLSAGLEHQAFGFYVAGTYVSKMREEAGRGAAGTFTDRQLSVDAGAHHRIPGVLPTRVYLQVRNVLDDQYIVSRRPFGARPNAPRFIQVGAELRF